MLKELHHATRILWKRPGFTVIAVMTLALGIGANTAIFSVVNAVLLRPLPYRSPDRLVSLWEKVPSYGQFRVTPANFLDWKKQNTVFEDVAAFGASTLTLTGMGEPEQLTGIRVSNGYFNVVGIEPSLGRTFVSEEYETGKGKVIILGHALWQRRLGGSSDVIGKPITLNDEVYTVVGVMPRGFYPGWPSNERISFDPSEQQYWIPLSFTPQWASVRTSHVYGVLARLKTNVTFEQAQREMNAIGTRLEQEYAANRGEGIIVAPFMKEVVGNVKPALLVLMGAVGLVLFIACANIAGLLLAQFAARSKEIAIRSALGAGRALLIRQFFVEAALLSAIGAIAGVVLAVMGVDLIVKLIPQQIPRLNQVHVDLPVLGFTLLLSLLTCLTFGLIPAWQASKPDLQEALEQGARTSGPGAGRQRFLRSLVVIQVSMTVMLVIGAGLLIKSFWRLRQVDPGFNSEGVLSVAITLPRSRYSEPGQINNFYNQLIERIENLPGVRSASIAYDNPLQSNWIDSFSITGRPTTDADRSLSSRFNPIGVDYFNAISAQLAKGRFFTKQDDPDHPGVAIVNEAFVRRYFPNEEALGQRIQPGPPGRIWKNERFTSFEIVGVVRDVKSGGLKADSEPTYYLPATQSPIPDMTVLVKTKSDPNALVPSLRRVVGSIDSNQALSSVTTLEQIVDDDMAQPRLNMMLMSLFGGLALLVAAVGIYGLLSYSVAQRRQEIGIRMALGAQVSDVLKLILRNGLVLVVIGGLTGLGGAFALTRLMRGLLFGVSPTDITTYFFVSLVIVLVALVACYIPARRAAKVDPLIALRSE